MIVWERYSGNEISFENLRWTQVSGAAELLLYVHTYICIYIHTHI